MINGLDLFTGIGGITVALEGLVRPVAYCENDRYAQGVLLSRMQEAAIPIAPIWDDIRTLSPSDVSHLCSSIDIIYGGFPCQDISVAGRGKGLAGERSGLFFEIVRLAKEIQPKFIFLENVPAICTRGGVEVVRAITEMGYDCRWTCLSAQEVGANHKRERFWLLGYSKHNGSPASTQQGSVDSAIQHDPQREDETSEFKRTDSSSVLANETISNSNSAERSRLSSGEKKGISSIGGDCCNVSDSNSESVRNKPISTWRESQAESFHASWWAVEPDVGRVANGVLNRVDRLKALGNSVVPLCAREAFKELMGIKE